MTIASFAVAQEPYLTGTVGDTRIAGNGTKADAHGKFEISANGIRAQFIPFGASITDMSINDTFGVERDIVVGCEAAHEYSTARLNQHLGGVTGRYTNRITNASFIMDGMNYTTVSNDGNSTLCSGPHGWDSRNWTLVAHTTDSIIFSIAEPGDTDGFPGKVLAYVTHTVVEEPRPRWLVRMVALSLTETSPIMLASRVCCHPRSSRTLLTRWLGSLEPRRLRQSRHAHHTQSHACPSLLGPAGQCRPLPCAGRYDRP